MKRYTKEELDEFEERGELYACPHCGFEGHVDDFGYKCPACYEVLDE